MDWIKKHYDRLALLLLAITLLASSACIIAMTNSFPERFQPVKRDVPHGKQGNYLGAEETKDLQNAMQSLTKPAVWSAHSGSLLVSRKYVVRRDETAGQEVLIDPFDAGSAPLHPPIPNDWFLKNGLEDRILDVNVAEQDPDKDGFSNLDEYLGKTNPQDPASHPGYLTKLRLKRFIKVPFRLKFEAYPDDENFQINTVDIKQPSQFVKMGELIAGTKYKAVKFEHKTVPNPSTGVDRDVSELTVEHSESGLKVVLVLGTEVDSPDQYALFSYLWDNTEIRVQKGKNFRLKPEQDVEYKLIDIRDNEAQIINVKTESDLIKVPRLEETTR